MELPEERGPEMEELKEERAEEVKRDNPEHGSRPHPADQPGMPKSIGVMVKESDNEDAKRLKSEIDSLRKKRDRLISEMRSARRTINYKHEEYAAFSKFLETDANKPDQRDIIRLKREKNRLEFKLSTEPRMTLDTERELVRRIEETGAELNSKLRYAGLAKKSELLKNDIDKYSARIESISTELNEMNTRFDKMYAELKVMLGIKPAPAMRQKMPNRPQRPEKKHNIQEEINLEDIAIIKRKTINNENGNDK